MRALIMLPPPAASSREMEVAYKYSRLPFAQRTVVQLFYHENLTLDQIAEVLELAESESAELFYLAHANVGVCEMPTALDALVSVPQACPVCAGNADIF